MKIPKTESKTVEFKSTFNHIRKGLTPLCCDPIVLGIAAVEVLRLDMV